MIEASMATANRGMYMSKVMLEFMYLLEAKKTVVDTIEMRAVFFIDFRRSFSCDFLSSSPVCLRTSLSLPNINNI